MFSSSHENIVKIGKNKCKVYPVANSHYHTTIFMYFTSATYPIPNFNGCTVEVCEWISNLIPRFIRQVITVSN